MNTPIFATRPATCTASCATSPLDLTRRTATERVQPGGDELLNELPSSSASPEREVSSQNELQAVSRALAQLPQRTRRAFEMHRLGGLTLQQVAVELGVSTALVHQLVHDALRQLHGLPGDGRRLIAPRRF